MSEISTMIIVTTPTGSQFFLSGISSEKISEYISQFALQYDPFSDEYEHKIPHMGNNHVIVRKKHVTIHLSYTGVSHVLTGDFKTELEQFRHDFLSPTDWIHFNSRLYTGAGWTFPYGNLADVENALKNSELEYEIVYFDPNIRRESRKEYERNRKKRKTVSE
uniref:Uncharacterized protein n=1 Tax=Marseillevirus LCMAC102 TaxID=2506603 RepID=A0A481YTY9_9VIRU|nr:MAG: hypothetical protein LCMAC102_03540 [Marseillevirus LCMAC102]